MTVTVRRTWIPVGPTPLQALEQTRRQNHSTHHTHTSQTKTHGDHAHQARKEE
jgi:hypothetical protein